jgi:hypothetical protein
MTTTPYMIKSFGVMSVAKFVAVIGLVWGFVMGIVIGIGVGGSAALMGAHALGIGAGIVGFVLMIVIGGVGGFIWGLLPRSSTISSWALSAASRWTWK